MEVENYNDVYFNHNSYSTTDVVGADVLRYVYMGYDPYTDFEPIED